VRRVKLTVAVATGVLAAAVPASSSAQAPEHANCANFAANVASLAQSPFIDFGDVASDVASSVPGIVPQAVVFPEQQQGFLTAACSTRITSLAAC
jgi:hypothetical protein